MRSWSTRMPTCRWARRPATIDRSSLSLGACLSNLREPRWQGRVSVRGGRAWAATMDSALGADARTPHLTDPMTQAIVNGCVRAKVLANPSGPGRFPLMRRCRLLIGYLPNLVGSATPFVEICRGRCHVDYSGRLPEQPLDLAQARELARFR